MRIEQTKFPAKLLQHARAGLLTLDANPEINQVAVYHAVAWLDLMAANAPGERLATPPETTIFSINAARHVIGCNQIPNIDRKTRKRIRRALKQKRKEMQNHSEEVESLEKLHTDLLDKASELLRIPTYEYINAAATGIFLGVSLSRKLFPSPRPIDEKNHKTER